MQVYNSLRYSSLYLSLISMENGLATKCFSASWTVNRNVVVNKCFQKLSTLICSVPALIAWCFIKWINIIRRILLIKADIAAAYRQWRNRLVLKCLLAVNNCLKIAGDCHRSYIKVNCKQWIAMVTHPASSCPCKVK